MAALSERGYAIADAPLSRSRNRERGFRGEVALRRMQAILIVFHSYLRNVWLRALRHRRYDCTLAARL